MTFDPTKPVHCRNGWPARIICMDRKMSIPIVALAFDKDDGTEAVTMHDKDGFCTNRGRDYDLINVPEKVRMYIAKHQYWGGHRLVYTRPSTLDDFDTFYPVEIEVGRKE